MEDVDLIATLLLGEMAGVVGRGEYRVGIPAFPREGHDADGEGYGEGRSLPGELAGLDCLLEAVRHVDRVLGLAVLEYDRELVPAYAGGDILARDVGLDMGGYLP